MLEGRGDEVVREHRLKRRVVCSRGVWGQMSACGVALSQDFRKFAKKSKAGADQEKNSKMAGVAEKNPGFLAILQ